MNAKEVSKILGVHPETVRRMIREGEIEAVKEGRSYIVPDSEVKRLKVARDIHTSEVEKERATMKLIEEVNSLIESELSALHLKANFLDRNLQDYGITKDLNFVEKLGKRKQYFEEVKEDNALRDIFISVQEIKRLYELKGGIEKIQKGTEMFNSVERAFNTYKLIDDYDPISDMIKEIQKKADDNK